MFSDIQYPILTDLLVQIIETTATTRTWLVPLIDQRSNFSLPAGIVGDMTNHLIMWDPFGYV
jgi:hypothetical protein